MVAGATVAPGLGDAAALAAHLALRAAPGAGLAGRVAGATEIGAAGGLLFGGALGDALADLEGAGAGWFGEGDAAADPGVVEAGVAVEGVGGELSGLGEEEVAARGRDRRQLRRGNGVRPAGDAVGDEQGAAVTPLIDVDPGSWVLAGGGGVLVGADQGGGGGEGEGAVLGE